MEKSYLERDFRFHLLHAGLKDYSTEFQFHPKRKWRSDFAFVNEKILIEIEGGGWSKKSRHTTGKGFQGDIEKYLAAMELGYQVMRIDKKQINNGRAITVLKKLLHRD